MRTLRMICKLILSESAIDAAYDATYPNVHMPLERRSGFTISTTEQVSRRWPPSSPLKTELEESHWRPGLLSRPNPNPAQGS